MAVTKDFLFETNEQQIARLGKALMHPCRVRIVHALLRKPVLSYSEIVEMIPLSQSVVDTHLRMLERHDLLQRVNMIDNLAGYALHRSNYRAYLKEMGLYLHPETRIRTLEGVLEVVLGDG